MIKVKATPPGQPDTIIPLSLEEENAVLAERAAYALEEEKPKTPSLAEKVDALIAKEQGDPSKLEDVLGRMDDG